MEKVKVCIISRVSHIAMSCVLNYSNRLYCIVTVLKLHSGMVTLSPMSVAPVCDVGDPLQLTCAASVEFIRWNITVVNDQGITEEITVNSNSGDTSQQISQRVINSTTFTFMRSSAQNGPLISTLSIDSVSIGLNGTVVRCVEVGGSMLSSASTTIHIIGGINSELINARLSVVSPLS